MFSFFFFTRAEMNFGYLNTQYAGFLLLLLFPAISLEVNCCIIKHSYYATEFNFPSYLRDVSEKQEFLVLSTLCQLWMVQRLAGCVTMGGNIQGVYNGNPRSLQLLCVFVHAFVNSSSSLGYQAMDKEQHTNLEFLVCPESSSSLLRRTLVCWKQPSYSSSLAPCDLFPLRTHFIGVEAIKRTLMTKLQRILGESFQDCMEVW